VLSRSRSRRAAVQEQIEAAGKGAGSGVSTLRDRGQAVVESAVENLAPRIESAKETLAPRLETAREAAGQAIAEAGEWAGERALPRLDQAKEQATTVVRERVKPKVAKAIAEAAAASAPARKEAKNRTDAAIAALRGDVSPPKRKRRWHRVSFLLTAGAVTGVIAALFVRRKEPTYPTFEPTGAGPDPYARPTSPAESTPQPTTQPTTTQPPQAPITSMNEEIAGNLNPTPAEAASGGDGPETRSGAHIAATDGIASTSNGDAGGGGTGDATIDVTEESVSLGEDAEAQTGGRHRKRTRGGQTQ
jgi:hypothetical protein